MPDGQITLRARIRQRSAHDQPVPTDERWEEETAPYEQARAAIRARVADDELILAWYVERA